MHILARASFSALCLIALLAGPSCSSGASSDTASNESAAVVRDDTPLPGTSAVLIVNGLSCPKCANNIHLSLSQVHGVADSTVDLSTGRVTVQFDPLAKANPSRATLAQVIANSGFTLVDVRTN